MEGGREVWGFPLSSRACKGVFLKSLIFLTLYEGVVKSLANVAVHVAVLQKNISVK